MTFSEIKAAIQKLEEIKNLKDLFPEQDLENAWLLFQDSDKKTKKARRLTHPICLIY